MDVYHAIADANRRKLLDLLLESERSVNELVSHFDMTVGAISQHLKILLDSRLVVRRKESRYRYYRVNPERLREVFEWTQRFQQFWNSRLDLLGHYLDERA